MPTFNDLYYLYIYFISVCNMSPPQIATIISNFEISHVNKRLSVPYTVHSVSPKHVNKVYNFSFSFKKFSNMKISIHRKAKYYKIYCSPF